MSEITTMSEKGQVVIPQELRKMMGLKAKSKFVVVGKGDTIIMKKLVIPDLKKDWNDIFKKMEKKNLKIPDIEIGKQIKTYRRKKTSKK